MKKIVGLLITLLFPTLTYGQESSEYKLEVLPFNQLTIVDGVKVDYICNPDSAGWAVFTAHPEDASLITFHNSKEHLTIQTTADEHPLAGLPRIKVYSASLKSVENSGDSLVRVFLKEPVVEFKARQIGNGHLEVNGVDAQTFDGVVAAGKGTMEVNGKTDKAKFRNVSSGDIDALSLTAPEVNCFIFGPGSLSCTPGKSLKIMGAGSGKVFYPVKPEKITNRSIGVKSIEGSQEEYNQ